MMLQMLAMDTVQFKSKMKNNIDALKEWVYHVLHNVLNVLNQLITVLSVFKEELMHQNVPVQMVNTLMLITNVKTVTLNV
jgi:hypothetical protein